MSLCQIRPKVKRNILVSCTMGAAKRRILAAKSLLKKGNNVNFYVNEDLTPATRALRAKLWRLNDAAAKFGAESKVS